MKYRLNFYPYLFAIYPVIYLYSKNQLQLSLVDTILPAVAILLIAFVLTKMIERAIGDKIVAAVAISGFFVWLFSYSAVRELVAQDILGLEHYRHRTAVIIWLGVLVMSALALNRFRSQCESIGRYLSFFAPILILLPLFSIASHSFARKSSPRIETTLGNSTGAVLPVHSDSLPDIYYIILDAYTRQDALKRYLGIDNGDFVSCLRQKGFFVAAKSHSNYSWTHLSLASSLNMEYLATQPDRAHPGRLRVDLSISEREMILRNSVMSILGKFGYQYVDLSIWQTSISFALHGHASQLVTSDFSVELLRMTLLNRPLVEKYLLGQVHHDKIVKKFDELRNLPIAAAPRFVYAHFLIPHAPYVFDENGNVPPLYQVVAEFGSEKAMYRAQLQYASKEILKTIDVIISRSNRKPIIVIQGDHGPRRMGNSEIEYEETRMSILSAYYVPDSCRSMLYDSITPVNSFRIILSCCFGIQYSVLPDKCYFSTAEDSGSLEDVTERLGR